MREHGAGVDDPTEIALGRGSNSPRPMFSGPSACLSASRITSIADGCRRTCLLVVHDGEDVADGGVKRAVKSDDGGWGWRLNRYDDEGDDWIEDEGVDDLVVDCLGRG